MAEKMAVGLLWGWDERRARWGGGGGRWGRGIGAGMFDTVEDESGTGAIRDGERCGSNTKMGVY